MVHRLRGRIADHHGGAEWGLRRGRDPRQSDDVRHDADPRHRQRGGRGDLSLASKSLATLEQSPYFFVAPSPNGRIAVATDVRSDIKGEVPTFAGQKLGTPLGPLNTDALVVGVIGESSGDFVRGYDIPPFDRVQPGDPGSLRPGGIAVGADGRLVVVATLDGKVNLDRCAVASDANATHVVIASVAP